MIFCKDIGGGGDSMTPEEKERLAQLEQERLEALRYVHQNTIKF